MKKIKKNNKGFTMVELLAVVVIIGLLIAIAIPSITNYITTSRRKTLIASIQEYIMSAVTEVNSRKYSFRKENTIYALPIECIPLEKGGTNPYGEWMQSNDKYWAYVLIQYDKENKEHVFGFTFKDSAGYGMYPTTYRNLEGEGLQITTGLVLGRPKTGTYTLVTAKENWANSGFKVDANTKIKALSSSKYGVEGDNQSTCTLTKKYDNYEQTLGKLNTDYATFESNKQSQTSSTNYCSSGFAGCYGGNGGLLEYDEDGGLVLDEDNPIVVIEEEATKITEEYTLHLTFKANLPLYPPDSDSDTFAATIIAVGTKSAGAYLAWVGIYGNYLHVYSFTGNSRSGYTREATETGFVSLDLSDYMDASNNVFLNVQVKGTRGEKTQVYINGEMVKEFNSDTKSITVTQATIGDLRPYRNLKFTGTVYEVELYNRLLSDAELQNNWTLSNTTWNIK